MKRFVITGGGTGGHLSIARALLEALKAQGDEAIFIGSTAGQDRRWFEEQSGFGAVHFLPTTGVVNRRGLAKVAALGHAVRSALKARQIIRAYGACGVISVGGFSAAPAALAAVAMRLPLFIHEQNAVMGRLNRLLRPRARLFFSSYDDASPVQSYPVSAKVFENARRREKIETVIFLGGSQGAKAVNDFALSVVPSLRAKGIAVIHQCGERDLERVRRAYDAAGVKGVELYGFTPELPALLARSDLAVSRAGASTLWELAVSGLPALFVPYPYAAGDHQYHNAKFLVDRGLAWLAREPELTSELLENILESDVSRVSEGLLALGGKDAAAEIITKIKEAC